MHIDTQEVVDKLEQAGVPAQQAKIHASVLAHALRDQDAATLANCSTKLDLAEAVAPLASKQDLASVKSELRAEFREGLRIHGEQLEARISANMRADFLKWSFTIIFAQTGLMALVVQLFEIF